MNSSRLSILLLLLVAAPGAGAAAQEPVRGGTGTLLGRTLAAGTGAPVGGAAIELWRAGDSTRVAQTISTEDGHFRLGRLAEGDYFLRLTALGYGTVSTERFELAYGEIRDLGPLVLSVSALELAPITVSAERTAVTFEADRTSYNLGVLGGTEGASVSEALRSIPELEIDIDGNVTIRGNTPVIYIDGRPAPMTGEALALFLEQFPAEYLARVDVMETPSARYGAEGAGGIVNLVLKEGVELGLSGSVYVSAGTRGQYGAGARGTLQRGPWTLNASGSGRLTDVDRTSFDLRQNLLTDPAFLRQDSRSDRSGLAGRVDVRSRFEPTDRTRFFFRGRVNRSRGEAAGLTTTTHMDDDEIPFLRYDRASRSDSRSLSGDLSAGLEYRWEPRRHELEVDLSLETGRDLEDTREEITSDDFLGDGALIPAELTLDDRTDRDREASFQVDYTRPWGERGRIETGVDIEREDSESERLVTLVDHPDTDPDGTVADRGADHRETVSAAYVTLGREFGAVDLQLGLRAENTESRLTVPTGETFRNGYIDWFPSANLSYRFDRTHRLRLSYSRRVQRPSASVLNPLDRSTDPLTRRVGNPDLDPQFTHSVSMSASRSGDAGNLRLSAYYTRSTDEWAETTSVDGAGVSTRTYQNIAAQQAYGLSLAYYLRGGDTWRGLVSVSGGRRILDASNLGARYSSDSFRWSSRARLDARVTEALSTEGNFSYSPPVDLPQGASEARYRADVGLRYRLLDQRLSVRLAVRDPFGLRREGVRTQDLSYVQIGRSRVETRSASISISYSFGGEGRRRGRYRR